MTYVDIPLEVGEKVEYMGYYSGQPQQFDCTILSRSQDMKDSPFTGPCYTLDKVSCWVSRGEIRRYENE